MSILICLSASEEWYGKAIRRLTGATVNHAFVAYTSKEWGGWWATQIDTRGVVKIPAERVDAAMVECYEMDIDLTPAMKNTRNLYGERYDWLGIVGFLIKLVIWRMFGRKVSNPMHAPHRLFCSEYTMMFLQSVPGMCEDIMKLHPSSVSPGGDPEFTGTPSLQWELQRLPGVKQMPCPWRTGA